MAGPFVAFYMPRLVYINISTLSSLPDRQFSSGMAEVLKAGLIKDGEFYEWLINNFNEIMDMDPEALTKMIYGSVNIKRLVVEEDPYEKGERAKLNFGHTLGHAIEKYMGFKLKHGECVALGTIASCYISYKREMLTTEENYEIRDMFVPFGLPISLPEDTDVEEIIRLTRSDKKMDGGRIRFVLLKDVGKAYIDTGVTDDEIRESLVQLKI